MKVHLPCLGHTVHPLCAKPIAEAEMKDTYRQEIAEIKSLSHHNRSKPPIMESNLY